MPTHTGRLTYTENASGISCSVMGPNPDPPPEVTLYLCTEVPAWMKESVRASGGKQVKVTTDDAGVPTAISVV